MNEIIVGIGEIQLGYKDDLLISLGLGSCVGVVLYDELNKIGGLAHVMLPDSNEFNRLLPEKKIMIAESHIKIRSKHVRCI